MSLPVFCLLIAQATAAEPTQAPAWPAEFSLSGRGATLQQATYSGGQGSLGASARWFPVRPIVDDGSPLALQAYLQRLSQLSLSFGVSGLSAGAGSYYTHSYRSASGSFGGAFYLRNLVLGLGATYEGATDHQSGGNLTGELHSTTHYVAASGSAGWRIDDFEILGTYRSKSSSENGKRRPATWGQLVLSLRSVVDDEISWHLDGYTLTDGGGGSAGVEFFSTPEVGFWVSGFLEKGQMFVNRTTDYDRYGGQIGLGWWPSHRFEVQVDLGMTSTQSQVASSISLTTVYVDVTLVARAPQHYRPVESPRLPHSKPQRGSPAPDSALPPRAPDIFHDPYWP